MSVWYLESDDEITDAVARLRATEDERVVLVVPPGSRIATGRINFRLLAREATTRKLAFAVVSPDEQVRALAIAGGVVARSTVEEAEGALDRGEPAAPLVGPAGSATAATESDKTAAADATTDADASVPEARTTMTGSSRRRRLALTSVAAIGLVAVGGWAGLRYLPTASITIEPESLALGPILVSVTASAAADAIDVTRGEIPAQELEFPLSVEEAFDASGLDTVEAPARGTVRFSADEQTIDQEIAEGTRVATPDDVEFRTTEAVLLEAPSGGGSAQVDASVEAVLPGPEGNVAVGAISVVRSLESQGIRVTNPEALQGGERQETPVITQADYEGAASDLRNRLGGVLSDQLRDPTAVPDGLTLFPETVRRGEVEYHPPAAELVGRSAADFELTAIQTATALAVDEALVDEVTIARLAAEAPDGMALLPETVSTEAGTGTARGDVVNYAARATGTAYAVVDPIALIERVRGLPVSEARSILEGYGTVTLSVSPDFLGTLPEDGGRIDLALGGPAAGDDTDDG